MKWTEVNDLRAKVQKLKGESDYIKGQHQEARSKFVAAHGEINASDVRRDLFSNVILSGGSTLFEGMAERMW